VGGSTMLGGVGSAGTTTTGSNGQASMSCATGGGGGAGWIRINTTSGSATLTGGVVSPDPTTPCTTQGTLK